MNLTAHTDDARRLTRRVDRLTVTGTLRQPCDGRARLSAKGDGCDVYRVTGEEHDSVAAAQSAGLDGEGQDCG